LQKKAAMTKSPARENAAVAMGDNSFYLAAFDHPPFTQFQRLPLPWKCFKASTVLSQILAAEASFTDFDHSLYFMVF
jgi:hypothetical protein